MIKINKKKMVIGALVATIIVGAGSFYFFEIPNLINIESHRSEIDKAIKEKIKDPILLGKLHTSLTWDLKVNVNTDNILVKHTDNSPFISTGAASIQISIPGLLKKHVDISEIKVINPKAKITRLKNGTFDIEELIPNTTEGGKYKVALKKARIYVKNYNIELKDKNLVPNQSYVLSGNLIDIKELDPNRIIKGEALGQILFLKSHNSTNISKNTKFKTEFDVKLPLNKNKLLKNDILLNGEITNLYPGMFTQYINKYTPYKFKFIDGKANLKFNIALTKSIHKNDKVYLSGLLDNIQAAKKNKGIVIYFPDSSKFLVDALISKDNLTFKEASFVSKNVNVKYKGSIYKYLTPKKKLDLAFKIKNTKVENATAIFPKEIEIPDDIIEKIRNYHVKGNAWGNLTLKGYYRKPKMYGKITYKNLSILNQAANVPKGHGVVDFTGNEIVINTKTFVTPTGYVTVKGYINSFVGRKLDLFVDSNQTDINKADKILLAIRDIIDFRLGPVLLMKMSGTGKAHLNIGGPFDEVYLKGFVNVKNGKVSYDGLAGEGHDVNGKIIFDDQKVIYDNISGYVHNTKVQPKGYSDLSGFSDVKLSLSNLDLKQGKTFVDNSSLLSQVKKTLSDVISPSGNANGEITLKGDAEKLLTWGKFIFINASTKYEGISKEITNINGQLRFNDEQVFFDKVRGTVLNSPILMEGTARKNNIKLSFVSDNLDLSKIKELIQTSPLLVSTQDDFKNIKLLTGKAKVALNLNGNISGAQSFKNLKVSSHNATIIYKDFIYPVKITSGEVFITPHFMSTKGVNAQVLDTPVNVSGVLTEVGSQIIPDIKLHINKLDFSKLLKLAKLKMVPLPLKDSLYMFENYKGAISSTIYLNGKNYRADTDFFNARFNQKGTKLPINFESGKLIVTQEKLSFNNLYTKIADSSLYLKGEVNNYIKDPNLNMIISALIDSNDIDTYVEPYIDEPIKIQGIVPVTLLIKGNTGAWDLYAQSTLGKGANIIYQNQIVLPKDKIKVISLKASGVPNKINIEKLELALGNNPIQVGKSAILDENKATNLDQLLFAKGSIDDLKSDNPVFQNFTAVTPTPISMKMFNPLIKTDSEQPFFSNGEFTSNLSLEGKVLSPEVSGNIKVKNVVVPSKETTVNFADIYLNGQHLLLKDSSLAIADSQMKVYADIDDIFEKPILINEIRITSPAINIDKISSVLRSSTISGLNSSELPPFIISDGVIKSDELIINNLITTNFSSLFNLTPDWLLSLSDLSFDTADGNASGELLYNIKNSSLSGRFTAKEMQANAAATTLLSLPNEVYGILNGNVEFSSKGTTSKELISNANGAASFKIVDGRLVRLGSMEYLLRAVNVFQSGVAGFNINSILDLIVPQKTGYFDTLEGIVSAKDGILKADNIATQGKNLSLSMSGDINMSNNFANIIINGKLSKKVSGLLGPLGSVSINTFINFIPGLGYLPTSSEKGLLDIIPGISRIPVLGLGGGKYRLFAVRIQGDLYNPSSVKSFQWLN